MIETSWMRKRLAKIYHFMTKIVLSLKLLFN